MVSTSQKNSFIILTCFFTILGGNAKSPVKIPAMFTKSPKSKKKEKEETDLSTEEKEVIEADTLNTKLWAECLDVCKTKGKKVSELKQKAKFYNSSINL